MRPKRFFIVMVAALFLCGVLIVGAAYGGNTVLKKQSAKLNDLKLQNRVLGEQQTSLIQAKKDIEKYSELDKIARTIVPQDKDQAKTVREITGIAEQSGIKLESIVFGTSNLGQAAPAKPAPTASSEGEKAPATTAPKAATATPSQAKAVSGIPGVFALEITISSIDNEPIAYQKFLDFLERLENSRRTSHVERISITPSKDRGAVSFDLTLNAYLKP